jgi:hypothetical protein
MDKPINTDRFVKSPLIFLFLVAVLVVSTLVVASDYFLRPQIEATLINKSEFIHKNTSRTRLITPKIISQGSTSTFNKALDVSQ